MKTKIVPWLFLFSLLFVYTPQNCFSKKFDLQGFKDKLPKLLGSNNVGKDFWITFNPCWETSGAINKLYIYVSSEYATKVSVEIPGKDYIKQQNTIPNDVIAFTLTPALGQCYRKTDRQRPEPDQIYKGFGVHVYSDAPIICYGVTRYQYTSDGFLALPVSSLGKDYVVASWEDISSYSYQFLPCYTGIIAPYDSTKLTFKMGGNANSQTVSGQKPGETTAWNLHKGDVLLFSSAGANSDLSGSMIKCTKPVAVISSNFCAYVPENIGYCDYMDEMELPIYSWGKEYLYTPIYGRKKNSMIKIFTKEDNTILYRNGIPFDTLEWASCMKDKGWLELRADTGIPKPIIFSGDKPIYMEQYNCGQDDDGVASDPFSLVLTPLEQYQKEITFNTPGVIGGTGFTTNYINIIYQGTENDTIPNDLMFAQFINGQFEWHNIDTIALSNKKFSILIGGKTYYLSTILLPRDGVYKIKADNPFAVYQYGFSPYDSYGFPAFVSTIDYSKNDSQPPNPTWTLECDGSVNNGLVQDLPNDTANRSNLAMMFLDPDSSYNYNFSYNEFVARDDSKTNWFASVIDKTQEARAVITFSDANGNDTTIVIEYYPKDVKLNTDSMFIGNIEKGRDTIIYMFLYNNSKSEVIVDSVYLKYGNRGFEIQNAVVPDTLYMGDTLHFNVKFNATTDSFLFDSIGVSASCMFTNPYKGIITAVSGIVGIKDYNADNYQLQFYPNPTDNVLYLKNNYHDIGIYSVRIFDLWGNKLIEKTVEGSRFEINTSGLASGIYYLQLFGKYLIYTGKISVVH